MRYFSLKNADTSERLSLMEYDHFLTEPAGIGVNYDIAGETIGENFIITEKKHALNAPSGTMIFSSNEKYNAFVDFCNCENLQLVYKVGETSQEYMMDVSLASCEKREAKADGTLECPVTFNGISKWYIEEIIEKPFKVSDSTLDHATFTKADLLHIGKAGYKSEISIEIDFAQANISAWWLMEMGLVYDDIIDGELLEMRKLFVSLTDEEFGYSTNENIEKNALFCLNSSPKNLSVQRKTLVYDESGFNVQKTMTEDLYKSLLPCDIPPFICTDKDIYLFICAAPDNSALGNIVGVKARCKRFVESV